jgi:hypothetical protein
MDADRRGRVASAAPTISPYRAMTHVVGRGRRREPHAAYKTDGYDEFPVPKAPDVSGAAMTKPQAVR